MSFKQQRKSAVTRMTIKLGKNEGAKFTTSDLVKILSEISFKLININLSTKKEYVGIEGNGYTSVGYVNGFDKENLEFDVVIFTNREESIKELGNVNIIARAFTDREDNISKIISLDVEPAAN